MDFYVKNGFNPLLHFKPIWQTTGSAIGHCQNDVIGSPQSGIWNGKPGGDLRCTIPPDFSCSNYFTGICALCHFSGKSLLEIRTNYCQCNIVSISKCRTDAGDTLRICGGCGTCRIGRTPYGKYVGIVYVQTIRICDDNVPCTRSCI